MPPAHGGPLPESIGPYKVLGKIGAGGMASIYRAVHPKDGREVALKVLAMHLASKSATRRRFQREADTLLRLQHPHILPVYDIGEADGTPYFAMRLLSGHTLENRMHDSLLTANDAAYILRQIAGALDFAHEQGVIHRDVKPGNILFDDDGEPYLADFGVARIMGADVRTSMTGDFIGTATYASPEQCRSEGITPASDIYSLGVVSYEMLTGTPPFSGANILALIKQHLDAPVPDPCDFDPTLPPDTAGVLAKALAKRPADRYSTATVLSQAIDRALGLEQRPDGVEDAEWLYEGRPLPPRPPEGAPAPEPPPVFGEPDTAPHDAEPDDIHEIDEDSDANEDEPPANRVLAAAPAPHLPRWARPGVYASLVVSIVGLLVAGTVLGTRLFASGPSLDATTRDQQLGITIKHPGGWSAASTHGALLFASRGSSLVLSDRAVPPEGPYTNASLVIVVQRLDPVSVFGVPEACRAEIERNPAAAFDCASARGAVTPTYDDFPSAYGHGVRLDGTLPPTRATYPIILLPGEGDRWLAVIVAHWDGYPGTRDLFDHIAQSIRAST
jgi:serine/threonine-protein kinase